MSESKTYKKKKGTLRKEIVQGTEENLKTNYS
jgi:hypothetical protein